MSNRFLLIILACIVIFGGLVIANRDDNESSNVSAEPTSHYYGAVADADATSGSEPAENAVVLTEYGDFQCGGCLRYYPILKQLKQQYQDQLAFQFRNYPLVALHPNAMAAHKAAEAAANQGKFWEMHDLLYERLQAWEGVSNPNDTFAGYASGLGLDMEKYNADVASAEVNARIQADLQAGRDIGVTGTPTFVLEGERIETPDATLEAFEQLIEEAIEKKNNNQ